jgi:hypothetical protein
MDFIITPNRRQGGVTLSLAGHWGNLPHPSAQAATDAAVAAAAGQPHTITTKEPRRCPVR